MHLDSSSVVIGENSELPGHSLHRVVGAFQLDDGTVVVGDGATNEIRLFDDTGALMRRIGGSGAGPEAFGSLQAIWFLPPDSVLGFDLLSRRLSFWNLDGTLGRTVVIDPRSADAIVSRFADGSFLGVKRQGHRRMPAGASRTDSAALRRIGQAGQRMNDLGAFPWETVHARLHPVGQRVMYTGSPFDPRGLVSSDSESAYYLYPADNSVFRITLAGVRNQIALGVPALPLRDQAWRRWIDGRADAVSERDRPALRQLLDGLPRPEYLPRADFMIVDDEGLLWFREFVSPSEQRARWRIVDATGTDRGKFTAPESFRPLHISVQYLAAVSLDSLDTEVVRIYPKRSLLPR